MIGAQHGERWGVEDIWGESEAKTHEARDTEREGGNEKKGTRGRFSRRGNSQEGEGHRTICAVLVTVHVF